MHVVLAFKIVAAVVIFEFMFPSITFLFAGLFSATKMVCPGHFILFFRILKSSSQVTF